MSGGLLDILVDRLSTVTGVPLDTVLAWSVVAGYLLVGAFSLRLFGPSADADGEPLWLTTATGFPVVVSLLIAAGEELLFRGLLQPFSCR